jgi:hypothetical protein
MPERVFTFVTVPEALVELLVLAVAIAWFIRLSVAIEPVLESFTWLAIVHCVSTFIRWNVFKFVVLVTVSNVLIALLSIPEAIMPVLIDNSFTLVSICKALPVGTILRRVKEFANFFIVVIWKIITLALDVFLPVFFSMTMRAFFFDILKEKIVIAFVTFGCHNSLFLTGFKTLSEFAKLVPKDVFLVKD